MSYVGTLLVFIGVFKYVVDRVVIDVFKQFTEVIGESLKQRGNLSPTDPQLIALDMAGRFWTKIYGSEARKVTLFTTFAYAYFVPGLVRSILFLPTYILTSPVRLIIGKRKMDTLRERTREIAVKGLWSFTLPLAFAILVASLFVQEVEYVRVVNGQGPDGPEIKEHLVKQVVVGIDRFSLAMPHHPTIYVVSYYVLVLFAVFHTISFFVILASYEKPS